MIGFTFPVVPKGKLCYHFGSNFLSVEQFSNDFKTLLLIIQKQNNINSILVNHWYQTIALIDKYKIQLTFCEVNVSILTQKVQFFYCTIDGGNSLCTAALPLKKNWERRSGCTQAMGAREC